MIYIIALVVAKKDDVTGGQLGLWIGASMLSIAEFISFVLSISGYGMRLTNQDVEMKSKKIGATPSQVAM